MMCIVLYMSEEANDVMGIFSFCYSCGFRINIVPLKYNRLVVTEFLIIISLVIPKPFVVLLSKEISSYPLMDNP